MKDDQKQLWLDVIAIKRRVRGSIGSELSAGLRASQIYQAYIVLCGEAQQAYNDGLLMPSLVDLLNEYADKVIAFQTRVPA